MNFSLLKFLRDIGVSGLLDIAFMSTLIYALIVWFKRSKAFFVLTGICIIGVIYLLAREFNLQLMAAVFQGFFAVILIAVIVIFQEEIKRLFERLAVWSLNPRLARHKPLRSSIEEVEILVRTLTDMAADRIGAIVVIRGRDAIVRHINGGVELNGAMSERLLRSLFNKTSAAHDGAVIIEAGNVTSFGCHLPLSKDLRKIQHAGTRHAAALGLSELTDALCLVVSEERGTISVAQDGHIEVISDADRLARLLETFFRETAPVTTKREWKSRLTHNLREKVIAVAVTVALWFVFVHEGRLTYRPFQVPVEYTNVPAGIAVKEIRPVKVEVTLSGPRRYFYFVRPTRIRLTVNMGDAKEGYQSKQIQRTSVSFPEKLRLESIAPARVRFILVPQSDAK
jgi:diadenylate cyclase